MERAATRTHVRLSGRGPVNSPTRITPENKGKIRPQPDREHAFARASGGGNATGIQRSPLAKSLLQWMQIFDSKGQTVSSVVLAQFMNLAVSRVALQQFAQRLGVFGSQAKDRTISSLMFLLL